MLAVAAVAHGVEDQFRRDGARPAEVRCDLKIDQRLDPVGTRRYVAAADRGGQGLGEAADPDHAGQAVEGGEARRGFGLEVGEDVVLNDGEVMGRCRVQQAVRGLRGDGRAGRVVERGIGDVEARAMHCQHLGESRGVGSGWRVRNAHELRPMGAQQGLEVEVAGIVHQHRVAGLQQIAADQVDCLRARRGEEDLVRTGIDAFRRKLAGKQPAQGKRPRVLP